MKKIVVSIFLSVLQLTSCDLRITCEESLKLFTDLCFVPKPALDWDFDWFKANQPAEGWYLPLGNDVYQLHFSQAIKGEIHSPDHDFTDMCIRAKIDLTTGGGQLFGYNGLSANWACNESKDYPGLQMCDIPLNHTNFHTSYISYHDKITKLAIIIDCFPNGQVGWATISNHPKLTEAERIITNDYIEGLGLKNDTVAILHGENCPKFNKL